MIEDIYTVEIAQGEWDCARFPHPLITVDYNTAGEVMGVVAVGRAVEFLKALKPLILGEMIE